MNKAFEDARYNGTAVEFGDGPEAQEFLEGAVYDPAKAIVVAVQHSPYNVNIESNPVAQIIEGHGGDQEDALLIAYEELEAKFQKLGGAPDAAWRVDMAEANRANERNLPYTRFYDRWLYTITNLMNIWLKQWEADQAGREADVVFVARMEEVTTLILPTYQYYVTVQPSSKGAQEFVDDYNRAAAWQNRLPGREATAMWTVDETMRALAASEAKELDSAEALAAAGGAEPNVAQEEEEDANRETDDRKCERS